MELILYSYLGTLFREGVFIFRAHRLMDQDRNLLSFECRFDSY